MIVTTQSKTKLTDDFGERASVRDAKHSFAVPQFCKSFFLLDDPKGRGNLPFYCFAQTVNHWHIPLATQVILSAAGDGTR